MKDTAVDLGAPGFDGVYGAGRADALAAVASSGALTGSLIVNSTGDGADVDTTDVTCADSNGNCTLRAAIEEANAQSGGTILFSIPGATPHTIRPASALPTLGDDVVIDGSTQGRSADGSTAVLVQIELDGSNAGASVDGLTLNGANSQVLGLAVNRFSGNGIVLESGGTDAVVEDNLIGTGASGTTDYGNGGSGIVVNSVSASIRRNVISGNGSHGISISVVGTDDDFIVVRANFIGTNADGSAALANGGSGISVSAATNTEIDIAENLISGNTSHGVSLTGTSLDVIDIFANIIGAASDRSANLGNGGSGVHIDNGASDTYVRNNIIAYNSGDGGTVAGATSGRNEMYGNSIHSNTGLGIDLGPDGVTANDTNDTDTGPNSLQNFPVLSAAAASDSEIWIYGSLNASTIPSDYVINFYYNTSCDASGNGEGERPFGSTAVTVDSDNSADIQFSQAFAGLAGKYITATATSNPSTGLGNTSEFSACVLAAALPALDMPEVVLLGEGATTTYAVALSKLPASDVTLALSSADTAVATVTPATLTFTTANWETAQTVTVTAPATTGVADAATSIKHEVTIGGNTYVAGRVEVQVADLPALVVPDSRLIVDEGSSSTYTMVLAVKPASPVTVVLFTTDAVTVSPTSHEFTASNWDAPATITVTAAQDANLFNEDLGVDHRVQIGTQFYDLGVVFVIIADDDLPELVFTPESVTVAEGADATYTVKLASDPGTTVDFAIFIDNTTAVGVNTEAYNPSFTSDNWSAAQTVTVEGDEDDDGQDEAVTIEYDLVLAPIPPSVSKRYYSAGSLTVTVTDPDSDTAPWFTEGDSADRAIGDAATPGTDVGAPITAIDPDGGLLTYTLSGADAAPFAIDAANGQISLDAAVDFASPSDADDGNDYEVTVAVTDAGSETDSINVTIEVTDSPTNKAPPGPPTALTATPEAGQPITGLDLSWSAPASVGASAITDHNIRYRAQGSAAWTVIDYTEIASQPVILQDLDKTTTYDVQVRAANAHGAGGWSQTANGTTANAAPAFPASETGARSVAENTAATQNIGDAVSATDADGDTLAYTLGGTDVASFGIVSTSGQLQTKASLDYETKASYEVTVSVSDGKADDGTADTAVDDTITVTVTVTDVDTEAPGKPAAPTVTAASTTSVTVTWDEPANTGPAITDYGVRYCTGTCDTNTDSHWTARSHSGATTTTRISGLPAGTSYQVQVRATNDEGTGDWSTPGTGSTGDVGDYDLDDDNLIEIATPTRLNAIRWDINGNGTPESNQSDYDAAFPNSLSAMGCPSTCDGYELTADLDATGQDFNGSSSSGNWDPIASEGFTGIFEGNGHRITGIDINIFQGLVGLFAKLGSGGQIRNVGLEGNTIKSIDLSKEYLSVGALVGRNDGSIVASYARGGSVNGFRRAGGLVGTNAGSITASYAAVQVTGKIVGGLVGFSTETGSITASYATGFIVESSSTGTTGGLVAKGVTATDSYWDTETSGLSDSSSGVGKTTAELQTPTSYTSIYANWNLDLDGDGSKDEPWKFLTENDYPQLSWENLPPVISTLPTDLTIAENKTGNIGSAFTATDADGDSITWSVSGTDGSSFAISSAGQLSVTTALDYEDGASRSITVTASDGTASDSEDVAVSVTNVDEDGSVSLSPASPTVGKAVTAMLSDSDGSVSSATWQWASSATSGGTYTNLSSATSSSYTPVAGDLGKYLRATASYTDAHGSGKTASRVTGSAVAAAVTNSAPEIGTVPTLAIAENQTGDVGSAFTATDADGDSITWSVSGTDGSSFAISSVGQLSVTETGGFDYEAIYDSVAGTATRSITVTASDGNGGTDSEAVTITVTDVDEPPGKPDAPAVTPTSGSLTSLTVTWSVPDNTGPAITGYNVQYRPLATPDWVDASHTGTSATITIGSLDADTRYEVQVRPPTTRAPAPGRPAARSTVQVW